MEITVVSSNSTRIWNWNYEICIFGDIEASIEIYPFEMATVKLK